MSETRRRKIAQLRAKAASSTFPHERDSFNAKADKLEQRLKAEPRVESAVHYDGSSSGPRAEETADERTRRIMEYAARQLGAMHGFSGGLDSGHFEINLRGAPVMPAPSREPLPGEAKKIG